MKGAPNRSPPVLKQLRIGSLNVCGLRRRLHYPEFREIINGFDIFGVVETKLDDLDVMSLTNYTYIGQTRKQRYKRKSGGLCAFIKTDLSQLVTVLESPSDYVLWLKLSKTAFHIDHDIVLGIIYQPPETSRFFNIDEAELLEVEFSAMCIDYNYVYLMGDMNARTSADDDFTEVDDFMADFFEFDENLLDYFNKVSILKECDIPMKRISLDQSVNKHGEKLLDICKGNNLFISSPEPLGSQGELIVYPSSRRPSVVRRRSSSSVVNNFKHLLLRNRWADQSQILCGASLGRGNDILFAASGSHDQDGRHAHIW